MTRPFRHGVLGSARQGAVAAFFLARWETPKHVLVAGRDLDVPERAVSRSSMQPTSTPGHPCTGLMTS